VLRVNCGLQWDEIEGCQIMIIIRGKVTEGLGAASHTLTLQMPFLVSQFPEVKDCYPASINVDLERPLHIWNPDFTTHRIPWAGPPGERFSFLRIRLECPLDSSSRKAWIYIPHGSPHYHKLVEIEVLTEKVANLQFGMPCQIHIPKDYRELSVVVI
jgi:CTP-dependent riboflavin kinase